MLGAFDTIWTSKIPVVHPQCAIALRVRFERSERGEHKVVVHFIDSDGKSVIPAAQGVIAINFDDEQSSGVANLILNIQGSRLEKFGEYSIDLAIDGQQKASVPLFVRERR
jgi:adenine specific DNA methylase Mod